MIDKVAHVTKNDPMQSNVLLTGSTGILGSRTLIELLRDPEVHVYCPVRANADVTAKDRILNSISIYLPKLDEQISSRIHAFTCDLSSDCVNSLLAEIVDPASIDRVIHCSALTSFMSSHQELSSSNQNVTLKMVDFVNKYSVKESIFVSSYSIFGRLLFTDCQIAQSDLDLGQDFASLRYAESKFRTEILLRSKIDPKLKTAVVRPGNLHPDSETGHHPALSTRSDDFFFDMLNFFFVSDLVPLGNFRYDITPVDWVAKAIANCHPQGSCETYHFVNPTPPSLDDIYNAVKQYRPDLQGEAARPFFSVTAPRYHRRYRPLRLLTLWAKEFGIHFEESAKFQSDFATASWPSNEELIALYFKSWKKKTDERIENYEVVGLGR